MTSTESIESRLIVLVALPGTLLLDLAGPLDVFTTAYALRQASATAPPPGAGRGPEPGLASAQ